MYDEIDMKDAYRKGFWQGSFIVFVSTLALFLLVGIYLA